MSGTLGGVRGGVLGKRWDTSEMLETSESILGGESYGEGSIIVLVRTCMFPSFL